MESKVVWISDMKFKSENRGIYSHLDTSADFGGHNHGPSPKESILNAMCACSGMDVVNLVKKLRLEMNSLSMEATAEKTKTIPSYFASVHLKYFIEGSGDQEKFIKCVVLSMTKFCGVSYMISKVCPITYAVYLNGQLIHKELANFNLEVIE